MMQVCDLTLIRSKEQPMRKIDYSDKTLKNARVGLSFREKVETARYLDRLELEAIELPAIENAQVDSLLIKSVAAAVNNTVVALDAGWSEEDIDRAWESLQNAQHRRLQVSLPVSSVQMEYKVHKKAPVVLTMIGSLVRKCRSCCEDVEFVAMDATRAEKDYLKQAIDTAIEAGATKITVNDDSGHMMPPEIADFICEVREMVGGRARLAAGISNSLGMADICAVEAVISGADALTVAVYGECANILGVSKIMLACSEKIDAKPGVKNTELQRNCDLILKMNDIDPGRRTPFEAGVRDNEELSIGELSSSDDITVVTKAVNKLGYDLSEEDMSAVFEKVNREAAKKNISARELDAIVASTALQVPPAYELVSYVINSGNIISATANIELKYGGEVLSGVSRGDGPVDAAFLAIESIMGHHYELDDFQVDAVTEGREAMGEALIRLRSDDGRLYSGRGISTDIIGASIIAYISALNKIVYEQ